MPSTTKDHVRQLEMEALRKLRHPSRTCIVEPLVGAIRVSWDATFGAHERLSAYEDGLSALLADNSDRIVTTHAALNEHVGTSVDWDVVRELCVVVDELEISIRVANALEIANIKYIWELVLYTEARLLKTKNFGRKSLNEVKDVLTNTPPGCMPLTLGMHRDDPNVLAAMERCPRD